MRHLSPRQVEILGHVASGRTSKETATILGVTESTVEWHIANILVKLSASSRTEAVAIATRDGLLGAPVADPNAEDVPSARSERRREQDDKVVTIDVLGLRLGALRVGGRRDRLTEREARRPR